jgi:hypothetical protein
MIIKATKKLVMDHTNEVSFTRGTEYKVLNSYPTSINFETKVKDDTGSDHTLGSWWRHFKIVK